MAFASWNLRASVGISCPGIGREPGATIRREGARHRWSEVKEEAGPGGKGPPVVLGESNWGKSTLSRWL